LNTRHTLNLEIGLIRRVFIQNEKIWQKNVTIYLYLAGQINH